MKKKFAALSFVASQKFTGRIPSGDVVGIVVLALLLVLDIFHTLNYLQYIICSYKWTSIFTKNCLNYVVIELD